MFAEYSSYAIAFSVAIRGAAVGPSGRRAAPRTAFGPGGSWGFRPSGWDPRRGLRDRTRTVPRYRLRFGLVDEGCVRRGRPGGPAGVERRRIGCQPPRGGPGSGPATFGKGRRRRRRPPVVRRVERWDGHVRVRVLALARNADRRECQRRPAVNVRSRDVGVQPISRRGEPRGRRKTGAGNGVRMKPDPAAATVSISLPRVNRWSTQMEWKGVTVCVEPGRLYEASGVPACAARYIRIPGLVYLTPLSYPIRFWVSTSIVGLIQYWNQQLATICRKQS